MNDSDFIKCMSAGGIDCKTALGCFCGSEAFYLKFLKAMRTYVPIDDLLASCKAKDPEAAFQAIHSLKSTTGNLGLVKLYDLACRMTECFRSKDNEAGFALKDAFVEEYDRILELVDKASQS
ncbi:MAG: Hpt domain-containing protein [Sphaerochaetaceae bacterium]|jgi:chemotaxis protein histidine kinase CheA|nr:Hpt domain-containing protein [Sphaerochaetaceae bacterium]